METLKIEANFRSDMSKSRMKQLRKEGFVTASVFGHDSEPVAIELKIEDFAKQAKHAEAGIKSLVELKIKGAPKKSDGMVILKEFYKDPLTRKVLDMQFQRINLKEKISVNVPISLVGEAAGLRDGGTLEQHLDELHVNCLPTDIPAHIDVDVAELLVGQHIRVADIAVPENVEILADSDILICTCAAPHVHKEAEGAEGAEAAAAETAPEGGESA